MKKGLLVALFVIGKAIPSIDVTDDNGRTRSTTEWRGIPTIVAPMYARCPIACPMIAEGLKKGFADSKTPPTSYRVVLFSFDPKDTPADLHRFRERHKIPLAWSIVSAKPGDARRLLDAIGYQYGDANGLFAHPNAVVALTPELKTAKFLFGTSYSGRDLDEALKVARGGTDWIGKYGGWMFALLLLVCLLSAVDLVTRLSRLRPARS